MNDVVNVNPYHRFFTKQTEHVLEHRCNTNTTSDSIGRNTIFGHDSMSQVESSFIPGGVTSWWTTRKRSLKIVAIPSLHDCKRSKQEQRGVANTRSAKEKGKIGHHSQNPECGIRKPGFGVWTGRQDGRLDNRRITPFSGQQRSRMRSLQLDSHRIRCHCDCSCQSIPGG